MEEKQQTIPAENIYPPGEQPTDRMQISDLGIAEDVNANANSGVITTPAPPAPAAPIVSNRPAPVLNSPDITRPKPEVKKTQSQVTEADNDTYFEGGDEETGLLEADLVSFREKGKETRFLSFKISNFVLTGEETQKYELSKTIDTEEKFLEFKRFVANLNWND